jgi:hypothetical protein
MQSFDGTIESKEVWREMNAAETVTWRDEHFCLSLKSLASSRKLSIDEVFEDVCEIETVTSNIEQVKRSIKFNNWQLTNPESSILDLAKEWLRLYEEYKNKNNLMDFKVANFKLGSQNLNYVTTNTDEYNNDRIQGCMK